MTEKEFQNKYHHFETADIKEALIEAYKVNVVAEGFRVEVVGPLLGKYCLMLESAVLFLHSLNQGHVLADEELGYD